MAYDCIIAVQTRLGWLVSTVAVAHEGNEKNRLRFQKSLTQTCRGERFCFFTVLLYTL